MATIKDIARAAGVSHATVSNVLNHKGIVSAQKIKLVQDTARAMGYRLNENASALRSGHAKTLAVILPDIDSPAHGDFCQGVYQAGLAAGYGVLLRLTGNVPAAEQAALHEALSARARYIFAVTSFPEPEAYYQPLVNTGAQVIYAIRGGPGQEPFIGFDMERAAKEIARQVLTVGARRIGLMTGMACYPAQAAFRDAFLRAVEDSEHTILCVQSVPAQYEKQAFMFFQEDSAVEAVVTTEESMAQAVLRAAVCLGCAAPAVITLGAARLMRADRYQVYSLNYRRLGREMAERAFSGRLSSMVLPAEGFVQASAPRMGSDSRLSMLSADSPFARALLSLAPRLAADTGIRLALTLLPSQQVTDAFSNRQALSGFDMARMDMALMDCCGADVFVPVETLPLDLQACHQALLPGLLEEYGTVDAAAYALPFDPGCHLLFYRQDLMEDPHFQRRCYEKNHRPPALPRTYGEYAELAGDLDKWSAESGEQRHGALLTRRASEYLGDLVAQSPQGRWEEITPAQMEAFVQRRRALEQVAVTTPDASWSSAVQRFVHDECAMMIAHSNYACHLADAPLSLVSGTVGCALPPGEKPLLGGGVIGMLRHCADRMAAAAFLQWLYSPNVRDCLALLGGCSPCASAYDNEQITVIYPWLASVRLGLANGARRYIFRQERGAFNQLAMEREIARICQDAIDGVCSCQDAAYALNLLMPRG